MRLKIGPRQDSAKEQQPAEWRRVGPRYVQQRDETGQMVVVPQDTPPEPLTFRERLIKSVTGNPYHRRMSDGS